MNYLSYIIPVLTLLLSFYIFLKSNIKQDTTALTTVIIKLENINENITSIKSDLSILRQDQREDHDRLIKLEQSINAAWKKIDELK
jgi:septal ring factor EnvC (AmiA/AmiB activator)